MKLDDYQTLVFDCDGVVLDSNKVKTQAFYQAALPYGETAAQALVEYHCLHGGVSRYKKFAWFIAQQPSVIDGHGLDELLTSYASHVWQGLLDCEVTADLASLRQRNPQQRWLIVSGGDQAELRKVFMHRGMDSWFDGGIFGSPDAKDLILARELQSGNIAGKALFLGDSRYDFEVAHQAGLDFVFISDWTEFHDYPQFCAGRGLSVVRKVSDLLTT